MEPAGTGAAGRNFPSAATPRGSAAGRLLPGLDGHVPARRGSMPPARPRAKWEEPARRSERHGGQSGLSVPGKWERRRR